MSLKCNYADKCTEVFCPHIKPHLQDPGDEEGCEEGHCYLTGKNVVCEEV